MISSVLRLLLLCSIVLFVGCKQSADKGLTTKEATSNGYTYEYVTNDDSKTRVYTLDNGLKVYLSVYKEEPRIQTLIPVKAGGKFDPANSTGLAHYLEHMMFKGTATYGTKDWATEKVYLDSIENMFQHYRTLKDPDERAAWYKKIDEVSNEASKHAIANEYDKMVGYIGAKGTNAYTTTDRTVYINDIPSNQLENWLKIESNRFRMIVNRLFHTELEAVYEEKNRSLDNDQWKVWEKMYTLLFKKHKYGTQTVIGTIEHLKNPSITDINNYFYKYYVPNNMAVCLAGDLDPDATIALIDKYFGDMERKDVESYTSIVEDPITSPREATIIGPDKEFVRMGFRMGGTSSDDRAYLQLVDYLLSNSSAGLIDLNLVQKQKVLSAGSFVDDMNDYSIHMFYGEPRDGQTLEEVKGMLLEQIDMLKRGDFEDWLIEAVVNDFKKSRMSSLESNWARGDDMIMAFTNDMSWKDYISLIDQMEKIDKESLMTYVKNNYADNYGVVYKTTGDDPNKLKVEKPSITKVDVDRETVSPFFTDLKAAKVDKIRPVFVDYSKDINIQKMNSDIEVLIKKNEENQLFSMYYLLETGTNEDPKLKLALDYLKYLGTETMENDALKKEFYKIGCDFNVFSSQERVYVFVSGLDENMEKAMVLFEDLLANAKPNDEILANLISDAHKKRSDEKKNKGRILWGGLMNYAKYGKESPFTNVMTNDALDNLDSEELIGMIHNLTKYEHKVMYYGPRDAGAVISLLNKHHAVPDKLLPLPEKRKFAEQDFSDPKVYMSHYDMVQAEIVFQARGPQYDPKISPEVRLFNEYFGGGMSSIVFQEIREAQGLAYSVFSSYSQANKVAENNYMMAYVGTQADKQSEAMNAMIDLINNLPESPQNFEMAKKSIMEKIESERKTKTSVFFDYLSAKDKGLDYDIRKDIYAKVKDMTFDDIKAFHGKYIKDKKYNIAVVGDENKLDFQALGKYGEVKKLSLGEVFGYEEREKTVVD